MGILGLAHVLAVDDLMGLQMRVAAPRPPHHPGVDHLHDAPREEGLHAADVCAEVEQRLLAGREPGVVVVVGRVVRGTAVLGGKIAKVELQRDPVGCFQANSVDEPLLSPQVLFDRR